VLGQDQVAVDPALTRGKISLDPSRTPQMTSSCETVWATARRRFQDEMLLHTPAAITPLTASR
jgi:hypothetical protein